MRTGLKTRFRPFLKLAKAAELVMAPPLFSKKFFAALARSPPRFMILSHTMLLFLSLFVMELKLLVKMEPRSEEPRFSKLPTLSARSREGVGGWSRKLHCGDQMEMESWKKMRLSTRFTDTDRSVRVMPPQTEGLHIHPRSGTQNKEERRTK
jgi:hypothetical protein